MKLSISNKWLFRGIALIIGLAIGLIIQPKSLQKYVGKLSDSTSQVLADGQRIQYVDVDNDGESEEFIYYHLSDNRQPVINQYSGDGEFQNAWYLDGKVAENFEFITGDYNNDSINEVFVFSFFENNLCLYGLKPGESNRFLVQKVPVYKFDNTFDFSQLVIHSGGIADLNGDGIGEVIFSVNSRFTQTPRRVFAYDIVHNSVLKSPELGLQLVGSPILFDFDENGTPEIFLATLNSTNQAWTLPHQQAQYSASIVLQSDLTYFMVPTLFESRMSVTSTFPVVAENHNYIGALSWPLKKEESARLMLLNKNGEIIQQNELPASNFVFDPNRSNWNNIILFNREGWVSQFTPALKPIQSIDLGGSVNQVTYFDIDDDHDEELLVVQNNALKIYRKNFTNPVEIDIPGLNIQKVYFSVKKNKDANNQLSIQNNNQHYLISYSKNRFYGLRYLIIATSVLIMWLLTWVLDKIHTSTVERIKLENEKFYLMQMDLIRNQLDPHFLFNALNSISFSINKDERKTAYYNLGLFSKFLRESIITLDEFSRSLEEEVDYVKNYLILEKFRFKEKFDYDFVIGPGVNKTQKVPKLILFSFIESALKKSVLPKEGGGRIEITIDTYQGRGIYIMISDTGLHRDMENIEKSHTKNMMMMKRIVSYFNQFNSKKIEINVKDGGTFDNPKGSLVEITIPPEYKYMV